MKNQKIEAVQEPVAHRYLLALQRITELSAGWDENGSTGPKEPFSWETVARMAMDLANYAIKIAPPKTEL